MLPAGKHSFNAYFWCSLECINPFVIGMYEFYQDNSWNRSPKEKILFLPYFCFKRDCNISPGYRIVGALNFTITYVENNSISKKMIRPTKCQVEQYS